MNRPETDDLAMCLIILEQLQPAALDAAMSLSQSEQVPLATIIAMLFGRRLRQGRPVELRSTEGWNRTRRDFLNN